MLPGIAGMACCDAEGAFAVPPPSDMKPVPELLGFSQAEMFSIVRVFGPSAISGVLAAASLRAFFGEIIASSLPRRDGHASAALPSSGAIGLTT